MERINAMHFPRLNFVTMSIQYELQQDLKRKLIYAFWADGYKVCYLR